MLMTRNLSGVWRRQDLLDGQDGGPAGRDDRPVRGVGDGDGHPERPTTKVSSDFAPRTVGFQAKAVPAAMTSAAPGVPGTTSNSRDR